jgi:hypothetical protein
VAPGLPAGRGLARGGEAYAEELSERGRNGTRTLHESEMAGTGNGHTPRAGDRDRQGLRV